MNAPYDIVTDPETDDILDIARRELRETPEMREKSILELRTLLHNATDLHYRDDDEFLLIFLRPCHFYPESALKLMRRIAEFRKTHCTLLDTLMPEDEKKAFIENDVVNVLTSLDQAGRRILIVNCGASWNPSNVTPDQLFRLFYLVHLVAILEKRTQVAGVVTIMDFKGLTMKQVTALSPSFSKRLLYFIQDAMPLRMKEVHMINQPFIFNIVWNLFKPFIREKLKKRMYFHGTDMKKLHKFIDPNHLPKNYGGNLPELDYTGAQWYPCVKNYEDHIAKWNSYGFANSN